MKTIAEPELETTTMSENGEDCRMAVFCEGWLAYEMAHRVCQRIVRQLGVDNEFVKFSCWDFNELSNPERHRGALEGAEQADIILLSTRTWEIPVEAIQLLETVRQHRKVSVGALAWLRSETAGPAISVATMALRLEQIARQMGRDFLPLQPVPDEAEAIRGFDSQIWTMAAPHKHPAGRSSHEHWGLNE